jgi:hypothetical protein
MGCLEGLYITQHLLNCVNNPDHNGASSWFPQINAHTPCNLDAYPVKSKTVSNGYEG